MSYDIEHFVKWIRANDLTPILSIHSDDLELLTLRFFKTPIDSGKSFKFLFDKSKCFKAFKQ